MLQNSRRRCRGLLSWQVFLPEYRGPWRGHLEGNSDIDCAPVRTAYSFLRIRRAEKSSWRGQIGAAFFPRTRLVGPVKYGHSHAGVAPQLLQSIQISRYCVALFSRKPSIPLQLLSQGKGVLRSWREQAAGSRFPSLAPNKRRSAGSASAVTTPYPLLGQHAKRRVAPEARVPATRLRHWVFGPSGGVRL